MDKKILEHVAMSVNYEKSIMINNSKESLLKVNEYFQYTKELRLALNLFEYSYNSVYGELVYKIWMENKPRLFEKHRNDIPPEYIMNTIIVNEMLKLLDKRDLSYIEAWEIIRRKLISGDLSINEVIKKK